MPTGGAGTQAHISATWGKNIFPYILYAYRWRDFSVLVIVKASVMLNYKACPKSIWHWAGKTIQYLIPFKVGPLWLHTLSPAVLPLLEALLKGLFWNGVQLCLLRSIWCPHSCPNGSLLAVSSISGTAKVQIHPHYRKHLFTLYMKCQHSTITCCRCTHVHTNKCVLCNCTHWRKCSNFQ
jgi:hypothetical protein